MTWSDGFVLGLTCGGVYVLVIVAAIRAWRDRF